MTNSASLDFPALLDEVGGGFFILDASWRFIFVNRMATTLLQRSRDSLLGRVIWDELPALVGKQPDGLFQRVQSQRTSASFVVHYAPTNAWLELRCDSTQAGIAVCLRDVSGQQTTIQALRESESWYRGILESQVDLVCRFLPDTTLTYVNDAYCNFFGKTREELIGTSFLLLRDLDSDVVETVFADIARAMHDPRPFTSEIQGFRPDGSPFWVEWVTHTIIDEETGSVRLIQAGGRDITKLKQLEKERMRTYELEIELEHVRELNALKDRFASLVSHELRTPLSVILLNIDTVRHYFDRLSQAQINDKLNISADQVTNMIALLDDMLTLSRGASSKQVLSPSPIDLVAFCRSSIARLSQIDHERHPITLEADAPGLIVEADRRLLEHIISNLLSNAVKYSPENTPIRLSVTHDHFGVELVCEDSGIGIPEDDLPHLFEPFHRAYNTKGIAGSGLGLAIVKQSVDELNGTISISSQIGRGSRFSVWLPLLARVVQNS
jgi:PAS domain S-box-containing protein